MTQIDKALATLAVIVLVVCLNNLAIEYIKLEQLKESTKAAMVVRELQKTLVLPAFRL